MTFERACTVLTTLPALTGWIFVLTMAVMRQPRRDLESAALDGPAGMWRVLKRIWIAFGVSALAGPFFIFAGYGTLGLAIGFDSSKALEYLYINPFLYLFLWIQFAFVFSLGYYREMQTTDPVADWPYSF